MDFLLQRANAIGAGLSLEGNTLYLYRPGRRDEVYPALTYGDNLAEFTVTADLAGQVTGVKATAWDRSAKAFSSYETNEGDSNIDLTNIRYSGSQLVKSLYELTTKDIVEATDIKRAELELLARANYVDMAKRFVEGDGIASVYKRLRTGSSVNLNGLGPLFDGVYELTDVRHVYNRDSGTQTLFKVRRFGL